MTAFRHASHRVAADLGVTPRQLRKATVRAIVGTPFVVVAFWAFISLLAILGAAGV